MIDYKKHRLAVELVGTVIVLAMWLLVTNGLHLFKPSILPSPIDVVKSFRPLITEDALLGNIIYSIKLNLLGLLEAVVLAIPIGLLIGLVPPLRYFSERYLDVLRFLPLTGVVGLFISMFGIGAMMKVQFLAFSIFLYLLPEVINKVDSVELVYINTARTLGASRWQVVRTVFMPVSISRSFDSVRVLAALSWTYIVVAEMIDSNAGGVGALSYTFGIKSLTAKVYATLMSILAVGYVQDKLLLLADRLAFPYKHVKKG